MSTRKVQSEFDTFYFVTFTCFRWISLFEIVDLYSYIYKCFEILTSERIFNTGYVIMPNHLHLIVYTQNEKNTINDIIAETKRFMAYEIVKKLKIAGRNDLLKLLYDTVNPSERLKGKIHNVFQPSADIKRIVTEKFIIQKLNYIHRNPVSEKWKLVENYLDYIHSSARFYELGEKGLYNVMHYQEVFTNQ